MNPETTITEDQIKALCSMHGIPFTSSQRIAVGFSNEVHQINGDLIIKVYLPEGKRYETELLVLSSSLDFPRSKVIAHASDSKIVDRSYIIMTKLEGVGLGHVWHELNDGQRESLIRQYIEMQQQITTLNIQDLPYLRTSDWSDILKYEFNQSIDRLRDRPILSKEQIATVYAKLEGAKKLFAGNAIHPVFWDIHLDNVMVDKSGQLVGFIDFEHVVPSALDYPLFALRRLVTDPKKYATEENEKFATPKDYTQVWSWYQRYYPKMFDYPQLDERIHIYQLLDTLRLLDEWSHNPKLVKTFEQLIL
jgi:hypothetical protein